MLLLTESEKKRYGLACLKVKIKHLAEEARIIRKEEKKHYGAIKWNIQHHRKTIVRNAARQTQLAYAYLRGKKLTDVASQGINYDWYQYHRDVKEIHRMVEKYGKKKVSLDDIKKWYDSKLKF